MSDDHTLKDPKSVVLGYFEDLAAGRFREARQREADDSLWWVVGEGAWPLGGEFNRSEIRKIHQIVRDRFPKGLSTTVSAVTAEGERVVIEAEAYGVRRDGRVYHNDYVFIFTVRDGLIQYRREYCNMHHAEEMLLGEMNDQGDKCA